jgi:hypothetical protein
MRIIVKKSMGIGVLGGSGRCLFALFRGDTLGALTFVAFLEPLALAMGSRVARSVY